jgi:glucan phosphoethanolaminetransferase (alkaline phosphatase superfamily)
MPRSISELLRLVASALSLISAGYVLNSAIDQRSTVLMVRMVVWLVLAALFYAGALRLRRVWISLAVVMLLVSCVNQYRVARALSYFGYRLELPPMAKASATRCGFGLPLPRR